MFAQPARQPRQEFIRHMLDDHNWRWEIVWQITQQTRKGAWPTCTCADGDQFRFADRCGITGWTIFRQVRGDRFAACGRVLPATYNRHARHWLECRDELTLKAAVIGITVGWWLA